MLTVLSASAPSFAMQPNKADFVESLIEILRYNITEEPEQQMISNELAKLVLEKLSVQMSEQQRIDLNRELDEQFGEELSVESMATFFWRFIENHNIPLSQSELLELLSESPFELDEQLYLNERRVLAKDSKVALKILQRILKKYNK